MITDDALLWERVRICEHFLFSQRDRNLAKRQFFKVPIKKSPVYYVISILKGISKK